MKGGRGAWGIGFLLTAHFFACRQDAPLAPEAGPDPGPVSPVDFNLDSVPYPELSRYHFFSGPLADQQPSAGVLPFAPITPLFSDYAHKYRFVWMPAGTSASYDSDSTTLDFPDGAVLIKSFYYDHVQPADARRYLETRLLFKRNGHWEFANYVWNAEQTEAMLDLNGSNVSLTWTDDLGSPHQENYRIPSEVECFTCHKYWDQPEPLGTKPQNLNMEYPYPEGAMDQLAKWKAQGYLQDYPSSIETVAKWDDTDEPMDRRVRAYLDMNCAHCHATGRHCDYRPMRFAWSETTDPENIGICVPPEDLIEPTQEYIVKAGNANRSMLYYRISSTAEAVRMPLMGRTVRHEEAIQLIGDWINALPDTCP
jgi:uncharacterized repeat protein (TIGR03806 family)